MKRISVLLMAMASLLAISCGTKNILAGEWKIDALKGEKVETAEKEAFIGFDVKENRVYGCLGVNNVTGNYTFEEGRLSLGELGMTMMAGLPQDMEVESKLRDALHTVVSAEAKDKGTIVLLDADGVEVLRLVKKK